MTSEELSAMWKELRPQIGNFMCRLDNEVKFLEVHHDEYVTKEDHQLGCDQFYDAGINVGRNSCESDYKWCIHRFYDMEESELFKLFGEDCPMDVLRIFSIDRILEVLTDYFDKQKQIEEEAARDAAKHQIDEWKTHNQVRLVDEYKHKSHVLHEEYIKKLRDIGLDEDGLPLKEDQDE